MTSRSKLLVCRLGAGAGLAISFGPLWALKAAGLSGIAPKGGNAFVGLVRTLQQNWTWLVSTGLGLVLVLIAGLIGSFRGSEA